LAFHPFAVMPRGAAFEIYRGEPLFAPLSAISYKPLALSDGGYCR
jgi:hypothetical protein